MQTKILILITIKGVKMEIDWDSFILGFGACGVIQLLIMLFTGVL